ncbi:hypothetical protein [Bradyrhizobium sp. DASA03007]|uniref:hypothetical protein n=1 Tax=unclassified Bradyrhizobium TaxID=2631580 RepID=UPI003F72E6AD
MAVLLPGHAGRLQAGAETCCELFCNGAVVRPGGAIVIGNAGGGHAPSTRSGDHSAPPPVSNTTIVHRHEQGVGGIVVILITDDLPEGLCAVALAPD